MGSTLPAGPDHTNEDKISPALVSLQWRTVADHQIFSEGFSLAI
jgi:hypothetical protein